MRSWPRSRAFAAVAAFLAAVALLAGCGDPDDNEKSSNENTESTESSGAAAEYVGLSKDDAITQAEADGRPWRIGREDDEQFALTRDYDPDRVTFEIDDGDVTSATLG